MGMFDDIPFTGQQQASIMHGTPASNRLGVMPAQSSGMFDDIPMAIADAETGPPGGLNGEIIPPPQSATPSQYRIGDELKPVFGGRNPIAETYDIAAPALDPSSDRPILDRATDAANFAASAPLQALRLPSFGDMAEYFVGPNDLQTSERRFVENNPDLLRGVGALGEAGMGVTRGLGQGVPRGPGYSPQAIPQAVPARKLTDQATHAVDDLAAFDRQGVRPFGPAFSDGPTGRIAKQLSDTFVIGAPVKHALEDALMGARDATNRVADRMAPAMTADEAGRNLTSRVERFMSDGIREVDPGTLRRLGIEPARPVQAADQMSAGAVARLNQAEPIRQAAGGGQFTTSRGVPQTMGNTRNQTFTQRKVAEDLTDAELARIAGPARPDVRDVTFSVRQDALYEQARRLLPTRMRANNTANPGTFAAHNTRNTLTAIQGELSNSIAGQGLIRGPLAERLSSVRSANFTIDDLFQIRREIGRALGNFGQYDARLDRTQLNQLYAAVSDDLQIAFRDAANRAYIQSRVSNNQPDHVPVSVARQADGALKAFRRADRYTREGMRRMETVMDVLKAKTPEQAMQKVVSAAKDGTKGNSGLLRQLRRTLLPEQWDEVSAYVLRDMGRPVNSTRGFTGDINFSVGSFLTRWNDMGVNRNIVFDGRHADAINDLYRIHSRLANVEALANKSASTTNASNLGMIMGAGGFAAAGGMTGFLGSLGAGLAASVILSRPQYARWAVNYARWRAGSGNIPGGRRKGRQMLIRLRNMIEADQRLTPAEAQAVLGSISEEIQP